MKKTVLAQGAEAIITLLDNKIIKNRIPKSYRLKELDEKIRSKRTEKEAKTLEKAKKFGINVPSQIFPYSSHDKYALTLEFIDGDKLSTELNAYTPEKQFATMQKIGEQVAKLHCHDIIHGDLTTSNLILKQEKVFIIDFGLSFISKRIEDKAVDLHLLKQALGAKHFQNYEKLFLEFKKGYEESNPEAKEVIERLKKVESRGRYKKNH